MKELYNRKIIMAWHDNEGTLSINVEGVNLHVSSYNLSIGKLSTSAERCYIVFGISGHIEVTENELDQIYAEYKRLTK